MIPKTSVKTLLELYMDEVISIFLRDMHVVTANEEGNEIRISSAVEGYVIHIDQTHIHLGLEDGTITKSIPHETVGLIEIQFSGQMMDQDMAVDEDVH